MNHINDVAPDSNCNLNVYCELQRGKQKFLKNPLINCLFGLLNVHERA